MAKSTKQLARELGLLRKRPLEESPSRIFKKQQLSNSQIFSYLIVIDFESTCWENDKYSPQEIIEFPAVLLNTKTGQIESEFHYYLQPTERPVLSEFCKQLTGIKQELVDNGIPLYNCLRKFTGWLNKLNEDKGVICADDNPNPEGATVAAFLTWSDWDLGVCLLYEAKRKQIMKPSVLNRWIDLRKTYKDFYSRKPDGLSGALKDLGILFDGREHSGLDDARNTAKLAWRMICDGCIMNITKVIKMNNVSTSLQTKPACSNVPKTHFQGANVPFPIALDNDQATNVKLSKDHDHHHQTMSECIVIPQPNDLYLSKRTVLTNLTYANTSKYSMTSPSKEFCQMKKKMLTDSTNIINSTKSSNKAVYLSNTSTKKTEAVKINQFQSKLPVLKPDLNVQKAKIQTMDTSVKTPQCFHSSDSRMSTSKTKDSLTSHLANSHSLERNNSSMHHLEDHSTPTGVLKLQTCANPRQIFNHTFHQSSSFTAIKSKSNNVSLSDFKTPTSIRKSVTVQSAFKRPMSICTSDMKRTPPLCSCGRRSKRRLVQNQGPNQGRWFFTCSISSFQDKAKSGCKFFQWEIPLL
ncbi:ERI1 exoribonuclease 2 isoform X2 [Biomphalaria glabrata]|uniref:GRF-type domain-containing protein n=1 Tax=Biomphalaria glabrata TaxID=6526 RepID=A0A2C9JFQ2_BIOGL|nr:ERI1 exoribonuclease 2 isoform X2 [Biomphalaria glabrata]